MHQKVQDQSSQAYSRNRGSCSTCCSLHPEDTSSSHNCEEMFPTSQPLGELLAAYSGRPSGDQLIGGPPTPPSFFEAVLVYQ